MYLIRSENHVIYIQSVNKTALSSFNDKRWLVDAIWSRPFGHKDNVFDLLFD